MNLDSLDERNFPEITRQTDWYPIDTFDKVLDNAGVYIFVDEMKNVKLVGTAEKGEMIFKLAMAAQDAKRAGAKMYKILFTESPQEAIVLKKRLTRKLDVHSDDDSSDNQNNEHKDGIVEKLELRRLSSLLKLS